MQRGSWEEVVGRGVGRFAWRYGVVCFGGLFFLANTVVRWLSNDPAQRYIVSTVVALIIFSFVYSLIVGTVVGVAGWYIVKAISRLRRPSVERQSAPVVQQRSAVANK